MAYEKIIIDMAGLTIYEPMATLTDLLVSTTCFYAFFVTRKRKRKNKMSQFFKWHFLTMGIATLSGGLMGHAFLYAFGLPWKLPGWLISMISISLLERAFIAYTVQHVSNKAKLWLKVINNIELLFFMSITIITLNFKFVEIHSGFGILAEIFPLQLYMWFKTKDAAIKNVFTMVALSALSALIFMNHVIIHPWFNHLALSHTLMTIGIFFLLKASQDLKYN